MNFYTLSAPESICSIRKQMTWYHLIDPHDSTPVQVIITIGQLPDFVFDNSMDFERILTIRDKLRVQNDSSSTNASFACSLGFAQHNKIIDV